MTSLIFSRRAFLLAIGFAFGLLAASAVDAQGLTGESRDAAGVAIDQSSSMIFDPSRTEVASPNDFANEVGKLLGFLIANFGVCFPFMAILGHRPKKGARTKADIERDRRELRERTRRDVDEIVAKYHARFPRHKANSVGALYARYSTRHQDSIPDQVRKILEEAIKLKVYVPREYIYFDLAVRGFKKHRQGLDTLRNTLKSKKVGTVLFFATNRLFRKTYRTLEFVDEVHKSWGIRCVFVRSGVDTNDKNRWEMLLHMHSMIDQFVVTMYVENIRAAHEGLLEKRLAFGTMSFGYRGDPISGMTTVHGKPRCRIVVDEDTATIVRRVYDWFVNDGVAVNEIIRRLNADPNVPLPPRCTSGMWTRLAVTRLLKNTRYVGRWRYGVTESVYKTDADYVRQVVRLEPLKEVALEELRIVDEQTWLTAQTRIAKEANRNRGRKPKDGDRQSRPRMLNGLFCCPEHEQRLHVGGPHGQSMICPKCSRLHANDRAIYSMLNRKLALRLTCKKAAILLQADPQLSVMVVSACRAAAEALQRPDPARIRRLRADEEQLQRSIEFCQRHPGETPEDEAETAETLRKLRYERNQILCDIADLEQAEQREIIVPTPIEVQQLIDNFHRILVTAATGEMTEDEEAAREIIDLITGGRIDLFQMGERKAKRGWLQGRFRVDIISVLLETVAGVRPGTEGCGIDVVIDYRTESLIDEQSEEAKRLYDEGLLNKEIAQKMNCSPANVTKLLFYWFDSRGLPRPDNRRRRAELEKKQTTIPLYQRVAGDVNRLVEDGYSDSTIARELGVSGFTVSRATAWSYRSRGQMVPTSSDRRQKKLERARLMYRRGMLIEDIAPKVGYSARGLTLALREYLEKLGETMPDGRSRRGNASSGDSANGCAAPADGERAVETRESSELVDN